ncbi:hypothetical protein VNO77_22629 [Canavalia gladiata]|uniref:FAS1 domain-containing protein n=1 Tax=Canavalia gladiata TaxID=3824 RepID=A0AAN9Q866_CANGL
MENNHIPLNFFLILTMVSTMNSITTPPPNISPSPSTFSSSLPPQTVTPTQQLNNIIDALIGAGDFTTWLAILSSANTTLLPVSATLFVPRDTTLDLPPPDPFLFPYHIVPQRLTFSDLLLLPQHARLPTLLHGKSISVTDNSAANFSLDATPLILPDLFSTTNLAVHGVETFLDYSLFGDGIPPSPPPPPPPPFLPIGDAIGTAWKSGGSCFRINHVVFLFLLLRFVLGALFFFA